MGDSAVMYFLAWDNGYIKPGDRVLLYKNTTLVDPSLYRVVGYDLLQFYDYKRMKIKSTDLFTMQIITDTTGTDLHLFQDLADMEFAWVTATEDNQSTFEIPNARCLNLATSLRHLRKMIKCAILCTFLKFIFF